MPTAALRFCTVPGCSQKVQQGRCQHHHRQAQAHHRRYYSGTPGVNYGRRWGKARARFLSAHPFCVECEADGDLIPATEVDHRVPHRGDHDLFWDQSNWDALCKTHHSAKTAKESGLGGTK